MDQEICRSYDGITFVDNRSKFKVKLCNKTRFHRDDHKYEWSEATTIPPPPIPEFSPPTFVTSNTISLNQETNWTPPK